MFWAISFTYKLHAMIKKVISGGQTGVELTSRGTKRKYLITVRDPKRLDAKRIALQDMEQERRDCQVIGF